MANFKTHISTSGILGIGYGAIGHTVYGMPVTSSILASGLCTLAGILPDVDADRGNSLREILSFTAAVVPMLLLHRARHMGLPHETLVLAGAGIYLFIRFVLGNVIRRLTVHRGMWHSIPAALIAGLIAFWLCDCAERRLQIFKGSAVVAGYIWHLILDEIYAVDTSGYQTHIKRSFGTAIKVFGKKPLPNFIVYGLLFLMVAVVMNAEHPPTAAASPQPTAGGPEEVQGHQHRSDAHTHVPFQQPAEWQPRPDPALNPRPLVGSKHDPYENFQPN